MATLFFITKRSERNKSFLSFPSAVPVTSGLIPVISFRPFRVSIIIELTNLYLKIGLISSKIITGRKERADIPKVFYNALPSLGFARRSVAILQTMLQVVLFQQKAFETLLLEQLLLLQRRFVEQAFVKKIP